MYKIRLSGVFILGLSLCGLSLHAESVPNKEGLVVRCHDLAKVIDSLAVSQKKVVCTDKLDGASTLIELAGGLILADSYSSAKENLNKALSNLQYAELNSCRHYIRIVHSKLEVHQIKRYLY